MVLSPLIYIVFDTQMQILIQEIFDFIPSNPSTVQWHNLWCLFVKSQDHIFGMFGQKEMGFDKTSPPYAWEAAMTFMQTNKF